MSQVFLKEKLATFRFVYGCNNFGLYPSFYFFLNVINKIRIPFKNHSQTTLKEVSKHKKRDKNDFFVE